MGKVGVVFKISTGEGQSDGVAKALKDQLKSEDVKIEDIGFGVKVIKALFTFEDKQTEVNASTIEAKIRAIKGVEEVDVDTETLV